MPEATEGPTVLRILLGTRLRRLRESRGISAQAAAKAIRGSESKISRIELGRNATWNTSPARSTSTRNLRSTATCWPWNG